MSGEKETFAYYTCQHHGLCSLVELLFHCQVNVFTNHSVKKKGSSIISGPLYDFSIVDISPGKMLVAHSEGQEFIESS